MATLYPARSRSIAACALPLGLTLAGCGSDGSEQAAASDGDQAPTASARSDAGTAPAGVADAAFGGQPAPAPAVDPNAVAVTVNDIAITEGEILEQINQQIMMQTGGMPLPPAQLAAFAPQMRPQVLQGLIEAALLDGAVAEQEVVVDDAQVREEIQRQFEAFLLAQNVTREEVDERMQATQGVTLEEVFEDQATDPQNLRMMRHAELIRQRHPEQTAVSDEDVAAAYESEKDTVWSKPEQVRASHILLGVEAGASEDEKAAAKAKAEEVLTLARTADVAFAELAKQHSTGPSAPAGGDLGFFAQNGSMVKPFEDAAFALEAGEISDLVETQFGYHIIYLAERKPAETLSLEQVTPIIRTKLEQQKIVELRNALVAELKEEAEIVYPEGAEAGAAAVDEHAGHNHAPGEGH